MKWMPFNVLALLLVPAVQAAPLPAFLANMAGCFAVSYNFVEDGQTDEFFDPIMEKATFEEDGELFHIRRSLLVGGMVQPHWREEWRLLDAAANTWQQTVYGPFEDFRYQCSGELVQDSWRCEALASPKPRRDKDEPYAKLDRENTLKFNGARWIHAQKNIKRMADGSIYSVELGWNRYERQPAEACEVAASPAS